MFELELDSLSRYLGALESLYKLQLHEEQQVEANQDPIQRFQHHERVLLGRTQEKQQHVEI